ncbi:diaminopimelate epimerase [Cellulomonas dongxiuzhuiae]|uniref:diaminopimelate epimerase n=1 Tax=Cellulomonas dongxiuzhuiae TaxID=2819979 RepID=UPI001AAE9C8C|nr:diaminopimelate epimerase [Cellulomonas dongxiuzhuiae]MBO3087484.1 diaminopimelate epimerase [Cellulomonas dongxiuzhuiae]
MTAPTAPTPVETPAAPPASGPAAGALAVTKGHGTQNDFVLVDDREGDLDLTPALVRRLCDRRAGIGADGVIRVVATRHVPGVPEEVRGTTWFMDYRNADGSVAQMCGNGVRVFARYAHRLGLWDPQAGPLDVGTRAGVRTVRTTASESGEDTWFTVGMGAVTLPGGRDALTRGGDAQVHVAGLAVTRPGLSVDVGNPHTVVVLAQESDLERVDLTVAPAVEPVPADGTNVELVVPLGERTAVDGTVVGRVRMRVHERGVGETRSCGTGAVAAAAAVRAWGGAQAPAVWLVDVPGGTVRVTLHADGRADLAGPAVLVADAHVDLAALSA